MSYNPIILALDYDNVSAAQDILSQVRSSIGMIKIGLEMFTACGPSVLELSDQFGIPIFLDLKLHDVPTTVKKTTEVVCSLLSKYSGEHFLSVHCFGGGEMCNAALQASQGSNVKVAGVSTLTSMADSNFRRLGFKDGRAGIRTIEAAWVGFDCANKYPVYVDRKRVAQGMTTFICAPNQLPLMRQHFGDSLVLITPGIRSESEETHDHARSKPASFALKNGSNWLVIGRPITQAMNPALAAQQFKEQVDRFYDR
jgi:orotidine-5'-phosphate decarboxylase